MQHPHIELEDLPIKADRRTQKKRPRMVVEGKSVFKLQKLARAKQKSRLKKLRASGKD